MKRALAACLTIGVAGAAQSEPPLPFQARIQSLSQNLENIIQQTEALVRITRMSQQLDETSAQPLVTLETSHTTLQARRAVQSAGTHLALGDSERALELAREAYQNTSENSELEATSLLKIQYEAERKLERMPQALASCLRFVGRGTNDSLLLLSCAHTLHKASLPRFGTGEVTLSKTSLNTFAYAAAVRGMKTNSLQASILLARSFDNLGHTAEASDYLTRSIAIVRQADTWQERARYTLALFHLKLQENGKARESLLALDNSPNTDTLTSVLTKRTLARMTAESGQFEASEKYYADAIALASRLPSKNEKSELPVGTVTFVNTINLNAAFSDADKEKLVAEYAASLCARGKWEPCEKEYQKLPSFTSMKNHRDIVLKSGYLLTKNQMDAGKLLGYATSDLAFTDSLKKNRRRVPRETLLKDARSLLALADSYGVKSDNTKQLLKIEHELSHGLREAESMRLTLASSVGSVNELGFAAMNKAAFVTEQQITALLSSLARETEAAHAFSSTLWSNASGEYANATQHGSALMARIRATTDPLSQLEGRAQIAKRGAQKRFLRRQIDQALSQSFENQARLAAMRFSSSTLLRNNTATRSTLGEIEELVEKSHAQAAIQVLKYNAMQLSERESQRLPAQIEQLQSTMNELSNLHARLFKTPQNNLERENINHLKKVWMKVLYAADVAHEAANTTRALAESRQANLVNNVREMNYAIDKSITNSKLLSHTLENELAQSLAHAASDLYPHVREFHDRLIVAIGASSLRALQQTELGKLKLARAAEERNRWMSTLQQTVEWELGR